MTPIRRGSRRRPTAPGAPLPTSPPARAPLPGRLAAGAALLGLLVALGWTFWPRPPPPRPERPAARPAPPPLPVRTAIGPGEGAPGPALPELPDELGLERDGDAPTPLPDARMDVACPYAPRAAPTSPVVAVQADDAPLAYDLSEDGLWLRGVPPAGVAALVLEDGRRVEFAWTGSYCMIAADPDALQATLIVTTDEPRELVFVDACGQGARLMPGDEAELRVPAQPCLVEGWRVDGRLRALADPVYVDLLPGDVYEVDLSLPRERMAGMGVGFELSDAHAAVTWVYEGSPAWQAGLRPGDQILEVDGEATAGMSENDFIAFGTGPEGSVARIQVRGEDGTVELIEIQRALLD
jgi:hypothetical protein